MPLVIWLPLLGAVASFTGFAIFAYMAWSYRYRKQWLNEASEWLLLGAIGFGGFTALAWVWGMRP